MWGQCNICYRDVMSGQFYLHEVPPTDVTAGLLPPLNFERNIPCLALSEDETLGSGERETEGEV